MTTSPTPDWTAVHADFNRVQSGPNKGKPLIIPADGGKPKPYRRMTSYVDVIADKYLLQNWHKRQVAIGLAQRDDLRLSALAHLDDKRELDRICESAMQYAKSSAAATQGTAFHTLTDIVDRGGDLPTGLPDNVLRTLDAFREATAPLKVVAIETKTVLDTHEAAGTPDRIYEYAGERYIGDTKTGKITFGTQKIAAQLAGYSRSWLYDVETGARTAHGCSTNRGIIMDVDLDACTVQLVWVDLEAGWSSLMVARDVWRQRSLDKYDRLTKPFGDPARPSLHQEKKDEAKVAQAADVERRRILSLIENSPTADVVRAVWAANEAAWDDELTAAARKHIESLGVAS